MNSIGPSHEKIVGSLGKTHDSEEISDFLSAFGLSWQDVNLFDSDLHLYRHDSKEHGFSLQFEDVGDVFELKEHDIGDGPFVLTKVSFWGYAKNLAKYHQLPIAGLSFESTVKEVEKVLGPSAQTVPGPEEPYKWQRDGYKISMHWLNGPKKNRVVTYWFTPKK